MSNLTPEKCYTLYMSIRAHFFSKNYDAIKENGRIKTRGNNSLEKRNDRVLFSMLSKKFESPQQVAAYFVANFAYSNPYCLDDQERGLVNYKTWQRKRQSITKTFYDDLSYIESLGLSFESLVDASSTKVPKLLVLEKNNKVNIESLCIMNMFDSFVDNWEKVQPLWKDDYLRIRKLASFIKIDEAKFGQMYCTFKEELKANHETVA